MRFTAFRSLVTLALAGSASASALDADTAHLQPRTPQAHVRAVNFGRRASGDAQPARRDAIKEAFLKNYKAYEKYAFGADQLNPLARKGTNDSVLAGWGGTIVDSMSTMLIMGLEEDPAYQRALNHTRKIDCELMLVCARCSTLLLLTRSYATRSHED